MKISFKNLLARITGLLESFMGPVAHQATLDVAEENQTRACQLAAHCLAGLDWHRLSKAEQELNRVLIALGYLTPGGLDGFVGRETGKGQGYVLVKNVFTGAKMFAPNTGNLNEVRHHDGTYIYQILGYAVTKEEAKIRIHAHD